MTSWGKSIPIETSLQPEYRLLLANNLPSSKLPQEIREEMTDHIPPPTNSKVEIICLLQTHDQELQRHLRETALHLTRLRPLPKAPRRNSIPTQLPLRLWCNKYKPTNKPKYHTDIIKPSLFSTSIRILRLVTSLNINLSIILRLLTSLNNKLIDKSHVKIIDKSTQKSL
ncbi:hypothetical protein VNO80_10831 [Phaseolus coccineus]|uniref:Uncharacterized protein n=1 Tax=Phaseolus coccineus TaxID=3886 RepID=A0AAN9NAH9_PHACN